MQPRAANSDRLSLGKRGLDRHTGAVEPDAMKGERLLVIVQRETQAASRRERIGHQPFPAGLVDGRSRGIGHYYVESLQTRCDRRRQPGRSTAYNKNIGAFWKQSETTTLIKRVQNRNRVPLQPVDCMFLPADAAWS